MKLLTGHTPHGLKRWTLKGSKQLQNDFLLKKLFNNLHMFYILRCADSAGLFTFLLGVWISQYNLLIVIIFLS